MNDIAKGNPSKMEQVTLMANTMKIVRENIRRECERIDRLSAKCGGPPEPTPEANATPSATQKRKKKEGTRGADAKPKETPTAPAVPECIHLELAQRAQEHQPVVLGSVQPAGGAIGDARHCPPKARPMFFAPSGMSAQDFAALSVRGVGEELVERWLQGDISGRLCYAQILDSLDGRRGPMKVPRFRELSDLVDLLGPDLAAGPGGHGFLECLIGGFPLRFYMMEGTGGGHPADVDRDECICGGFEVVHCVPPQGAGELDRGPGSGRRRFGVSFRKACLLTHPLKEKGDLRAHVRQYIGVEACRQRMGLVVEARLAGRTVAPPGEVLGPPANTGGRRAARAAKAKEGDWAEFTDVDLFRLFDPANKLESVEGSDTRWATCAASHLNVLLHQRHRLRRLMGMCRRRSAYTILGLEPGATSEEVDRAYRAAALRAHPDKRGSTEAFQELQAAYETLLKQREATKAGGASGKQGREVEEEPEAKSESSGGNKSSKSTKESLLEEPLVNFKVLIDQAEVCLNVARLTSDLIGHCISTGPGRDGGIRPAWAAERAAEGAMQESRAVEGVGYLTRGCSSDVVPLLSRVCKACGEHTDNDEGRYLETESKALMKQLLEVKKLAEKTVQASEDLMTVACALQSEVDGEATAGESLNTLPTTVTMAASAAMDAVLALGLAQARAERVATAMIAFGALPPDEDKVAEDDEDEEDSDGESTCSSSSRSSRSTDQGTEAIADEFTLPTDAGPARDEALATLCEKLFKVHGDVLDLQQEFRRRLEGSDGALVRERISVSAVHKRMIFVLLAEVLRSTAARLRVVWCAGADSASVSTASSASRDCAPRAPAPLDPFVSHEWAEEAPAPEPPKRGKKRRPGKGALPDDVEQELVFLRAAAAWDRLASPSFEARLLRMACLLDAERVVRMLREELLEPAITASEGSQCEAEVRRFTARIINELWPAPLPKRA